MKLEVVVVGNTDSVKIEETSVLEKLERTNVKLDEPDDIVGLVMLSVPVRVVA